MIGCANRHPQTAYPMIADQIATAKTIDFCQLEGWAEDDHSAALAVFLGSSDLLTGRQWAEISKLGHDAVQSRAASKQFFEAQFSPTLIGYGPAMFTGYYEPELQASPFPTQRFAYPIYAKPPELGQDDVWHRRDMIENTGALRGRGLELAWLDNPVDVFFLMVQGSGRLLMPDGSRVRVGFGGKNNQPYTSLGQAMIARGLLTVENASAQTIRAWLHENPALGADLMNCNPSFVFFKILPDVPDERGPIGTMGRSVTALRSIAVDPEFTPLGIPVWVEKGGQNPMRALMIAQDTGGAIKGAQRADIFYGTGASAGDAAGAVKDSGRMVLLLPKSRPALLVGGG